MKRLIGHWQGTGIASFPTIATTSYREQLTIEAHGDDPILKVEQITWRIHPDESESLLYWECGFIRQINERQCEWTNAQNNGRTEVLHGDIIIMGDSLKLDLSSKVFSNDTRMISSTRLIEVRENQLRYTMQMSTTASPTLETHLSATLQRQ